MAVTVSTHTPPDRPTAPPRGAAVEHAAVARTLRGILLLVVVAAACGTGTDGTPVVPPTTPALPPAPPTRMPEPTPVTGVKVVETGPDFIVLAWDPVPGATRYQILVDLNESGEWDDHYSSEPCFRLEGLEPSALVRIVVRVREIAGERVSWPGSVAVQTETPPPPRNCSDEPERARRYQSVLVGEWEGSPFRFDVIANFPDRIPEAALVEHLLAPVADAADQIEQQLGYRIIEAGEVFPVPEGMPRGWDADGVAYRLSCPLPRSRGQIFGHYMDDADASWGAQAHPRCATFSYFPAGLGSMNGGVTIHEIWHLFGFEHDFETAKLESGRGVPMSMRLTQTSGPPGASVLTFTDIDLLRCLFPQDTGAP